MTNLRLLVASLVFAVLGFVLLSCGDRGGADPGPTNGPELDTTYVVTGVTEGGQARRLVPGSEIRLRFDGDRLGITAGCNTMGGRYTLSGTRLTVSDLSMTEMGCETALMEQDAWVAGLFERDTRLLRGSAPSLISGDVVLSLADREQVSPDKPLLGTTWTLDGIGVGGDDGAVSSVPAGVVATVRFGADGTVQVRDGCNGGDGPAVVGEDTITWGDRSSDLRACPEPGIATVVEAFAAVLDGTTTFTIEEKSLTIARGDRFLTFRAN